MRFIPLIPLVLLWLGTVLIQSLSVGDETESEQQFSAFIQNANVIGTKETIATKFNATKLQILPDVMSADSVTGELNLGAQEFVFQANNVAIDPSTGLIKLIGDVLFRQNENVLRTNQAVLNEAGSISGGATQISFGNSLAHADKFEYSPNGDLLLEGNITASIINE